jgi:glyoxylase-like metal-dependent hydrolase (beta-lactamase superfamily II)
MRSAHSQAQKEQDTMRIHALSTGTVSIHPRQVQGEGRGLLRVRNTLRDTHWTDPLPIYVWVIEHPEGLIVIDTGETARVNQPGYLPESLRQHPRAHFQVEPEEEIGPLLRGVGLSPDDVRWVVLTHLHMDHDGGLAHFPKAEILVSRAEYRSANGPFGKILGYLPQHWPSWFAPRLVDFAPQPFGPFPASLPLTRAGDVTLAPTPGHSFGHLSVVLQQEGHSIFFAGDTSYTQDLLLAGAVDGVTLKERAARQTMQRIQQYLRETPTVYLPSHDPESAKRLEEGRVVVASAPVA